MKIFLAESSEAAYHDLSLIIHSIPLTTTLYHSALVFTLAQYRYQQHK
jgi:hypothetical protein